MSRISTLEFGAGTSVTLHGSEPVLAVSPPDVAASAGAPRGRAFLATTTIYGPDGQVVAAVDETCERVDEASLDWLAEQGHVVPGFAEGT
jgi:hypothetical protein